MNLTCLHLKIIFILPQGSEEQQVAIAAREELLHLIPVRDDSGDWTSVITEDAMKVARFRIHFEVRVDVLINGMRVLGKEGIRMTARCLTRATGRVCLGPWTL